MVFTVAEIGTNWKGNIVILDRMVERCKKAGVSAVKFQALSKELLSRHPELNWYGKASINENNVDLIDRLCKNYNIEWFCTPTYIDSIGFLDPFVKRWKIRYADNKNKELIEKCVSTGKPVYVSMSRYDDVNIKGIKKIYCISKYPTSFGELNFDMIKIMDGYSNHCLDITALFRAVRYGAEYIEFHIQDNPSEFSIDSKVSLNYEQMQEFMEWIK